MGVRNACCGDGRRTEVAKGRVEWWALVISGVESLGSVICTSLRKTSNKAAQFVTYTNHGIYKQIKLLWYIERE